MRTTTSTLAAAITARQRTLTAPLLLVDWDGDGFGAAGSVDDLSGHLVDVTVDGTLQSDLPDEVRLVQGTAARTLTARLGGGSATNGGVPAGMYFSPVAASSTDVPLGGKERRNRPCQLWMGFVTSAGVEWVPTFVGLTTNLPVAGGQVQLTATDNRSKLRAQLSLPALPAAYTSPTTGDLIAPGLEATWLVSYVLAKNGIYASPPPRAGARIWAPMHGSAQPVLHDELGGLFSAHYVSDTAGEQVCRFVNGPYVTSLSAGTAGGPDYSDATIVPTPTGTALYDQYGRSKGRVEAWLTLPAATLTGPLDPAYLSVNNDEAALVWRRTTPQVDVYLGGLLRTTLTGAAVASLYDGDPHPVGLWWDRSTGAYRVWLDGTLTTGSIAALPASGTSPGERWPFYLAIQAGAAVAELHVTAGTEATDLWIDQTTWTLGALLDRSDNQLDAIVPDDTAVDSWELLKSVAAAERGAVYFDAGGYARYRTPSALATAQAQNVQTTLTSLTNVTALTIEPDVSRVRNVITVPWTRVVVHAATPDHAYDAPDVFAVPPGRTLTQQVTLKGPTLGGTIGVTLQVNTKADGTGTNVGPVSTSTLFATCGTINVQVTMVDALTAKVALTNTSGGWRYLCDTTGAAMFGLRGVYCTADSSVAAASASDQTSIAAYGTMSLAVGSSAWRQSAGWAAGIAAQTLADTANPLPAITSLEVVADPRIEYYDRVRIQDPTGTLLDGTYWVKAIRLTRSGSSFRMTVAAAATRDIALFDQTPGFDVGVWS